MQVMQLNHEYVFGEGTCIFINYHILIGTCIEIYTYIDTSIQVLNCDIFLYLEKVYNHT